MDPVPDPLLLRKSGSAGNRTRDLCICSQNICSQKLWPLDHRGGLHIQLDKCHFTNVINVNASSTKSHVETVFLVYRPHTYSWSKRSIVFLAQVRGASNPPQYQNTPTVPVAQPAIMQPTQELPPPSYTKTGQQQQPQVQQQFSTAEFQVIDSSWDWRCEVNRYPGCCLLFRVICRKQVHETAVVLFL